MDTQKLIKYAEELLELKGERTEVDVAKVRTFRSVAFSLLAIAKMMESKQPIQVTMQSRPIPPQE